MAPKRKLTIFADESGSVALDGFFLVAVVILPLDDMAAVTDSFLALEKSSDRSSRKWVRTNDARKGDFLEGLEPILVAIQPIHWRAQRLAGDLVSLTAATVADAARARDPEAIFRVQIDGFNPSECNQARRAFSERGVTYRRIVGGRDESSPLLRLADSLAGFLSDVRKSKPYVLPHWRRLEKFFHEL